MRPFLIAAIVLGAGAVHYANGSPVSAAYLFLGILLLASGFYSRGMQGRNYWLSLTGLIEVWFIFDYCIYGTAVSVLGRSKAPMPLPLDEAYSSAYVVGALAVTAFACGAFAGFARAGLGARDWGLGFSPGARVIFWTFTVAGIVGLIVLLLDPENRQQLLFEHVGLSPREGMGRYTALLFMLPTTAAGLWYLSASKRPSLRVATMAGLFLIAAIHLGYGRRMMWAGTLLMIFHLLKVRGIFTLRVRHLAAALPLVILISAWMEASKNLGWYAAVDQIEIRELVSGSKLLGMVDNSAGRFDTTAALIADRDSLPYYYGETFLLASLQALPVSAGLPRSRGVRDELGELIYGAFGQGLVSQEASLVGELYANFGYFGVFAGFLAVGFAASFLDGRCHHNPNPVVAIGYGLCLFRVVHQLATASTSWFPLTLWAFLPWICALAVARLRGQRA
jgi:hypothetical protein